MPPLGGQALGMDGDGRGDSSAMFGGAVGGFVIGGAGDPSIVSALLGGRRSHYAGGGNGDPSIASSGGGHMPVAAGRRQCRSQPCDRGGGADGERRRRRWLRWRRSAR